MARKKDGMSGTVKSAVLLVSLGSEIAGPVIGSLTDDEIERISLEIADMKMVSKELRLKVTREFYSIIAAQAYVSKGGFGYAKDLLSTALDKGKANDILRKVQGAMEKRDFHLLRSIDPMQLANFIQNEHPQTIALIVSHLDPNQAAAILSRLPEELQVEVALRISLMEPASPEIIAEVEEALESKTASLINAETSTYGSVDSIVNMLLESDRATEKKIIEGIEQEYPDIANSIRNQMFLFEDLIKMDNKDIQAVLKEVETGDLVLALKVSSDELKELILGNMSTRASKTLMEDLEVLGPVKLKFVEEAQQKIVGVVRKLEEEGTISGARGSGEDEVVI